MDRRLAGAVALLFFLGGLAGCGALVDEVDSLSGPDSLTGSGEHPFAGGTVTVAVEGTDRERALAAEGLAYWAANATEYAGFDVEFRVLEPGATPANRPDVRLRFVGTVAACGDTAFPAGCAPRLNASSGSTPTPRVGTSRRSSRARSTPATDRTRWRMPTPTTEAATGTSRRAAPMVTSPRRHHSRV